MNNVELIFGAPGCGKTTYLMNILEKELDVYMPQRVAFVSFTKRGVEEGLSRAKNKFNLDSKDFPYFRTLHSICFKEQRVSTYDILGKRDYRRFSDAMDMHFVGYYSEEFYHNDDQYLYMYFLKKNNYEMYKAIRDSNTLDIDMRKLKHIALNYNRYKEHYNKLDFTDLLTRTIKQKIQLEIDVAFIDEAQDLTTLQWQVCETLFAKAHKVYIAGDDDQAIYEWTGADTNYFLNIEGNRTILKKTWRLNKDLLQYSKGISSMIKNRVEKDVVPSNDEEGNIQYYNDIYNFEFNPKESYYCLARNNVHLKKYTTELKRQAKTFFIKGKPSIDTNIIHAINNFKEYASGSMPHNKSVKIDPFIRRDVTVTPEHRWFEAIDLKDEDTFYYRQLIQNKVNIKPEEINITVGTIHSVKGGEADNVILLMDVTTTVHKAVYSELDSEIRVLYVACTRAKKNLHIVHSNSKHSYEMLLERAKNEV